MCAKSGIMSFFFNDTATTEIYTLSLHDALPIWMLNEVLTKALTEVLNETLNETLNEALDEAPNEALNRTLNGTLNKRLSETLNKVRITPTQSPLHAKAMHSH